MYNLRIEKQGGQWIFNGEIFKSRKDAVAYAQSFSTIKQDKPADKGEELVTRYWHVNQQAEIEKQKKRDRLCYVEHWWENLHSVETHEQDEDGKVHTRIEKRGILDEDDVYDLTGETRPLKSIVSRTRQAFAKHHHEYSFEHIDIHAADNFGQDVLRDAMLNIVLDAYDIHIKAMQKLTARQKTAMALARQAVLEKATETIFVAKQMGIHHTSAWRLLKAISEKTAIFSNQNVILKVENEVEKQVDLAVRTTPRDCSWCGLHVPYGRFPLCPKCHTRFNQKGDYRNTSPQEVDKFILASNRDYWKRVQVTLNEMDETAKVVTLPVIARQRKAG